jgi:hypothetical protein
MPPMPVTRFMESPRSGGEQNDLYLRRRDHDPANASGECQISK